MKRYIDAEKLIAEIRRYKNKADERLKIKGRTFSDEQKDLALQNLCGNLLYFIESLQKEQPEVDLEKEIKDKYSCDTSTLKTREQYAKLARHFYEFGLNARKED